MPVAGRDHITRWAVDYLSGAKNEAHRLDAMLEAALERKYSASPASRSSPAADCYTFENFDAADNGRIVTVREGLQRSVNLVFVRLMRDIVYHTMFSMPSSSATLLDDDDDPARKEYLARFADREGSDFMHRFYRKYQGKNAAEAEELLLQGIRPTPRRLATIFRTHRPAGDAWGCSPIPATQPAAKPRSPTARVARLYERLRDRPL